MSVQSLHSSPTSASVQQPSNQWLEKLITGLLLTIALSLVAGNLPGTPHYATPTKATAAEAID